ncbi:MAG: type IV secretory system conjugative DNA transfer family protein [Burkholderiales bacterium]
MSSNWLSWFQPSPKQREAAETRELVRRVRDEGRRATLRDEKAILDLATEIVFEVCERHGVTPAAPLADALYWVIHDLVYFDGLRVETPADDDLATLTLDEGVRLRAKLNRHLHYVAAEDRLLPVWREKLVWIFAGMLEYFPPSAFTDIDEDGHATDDSVVFPKARALDLCDSLPVVLERLLATLYDDDVADARLFEGVRERLTENIHRASGFEPPYGMEARGKLVFPTKSKLKDPGALVDTYLRGTPFQRFFYAELPFAIPFPARFEHTHVVGGTGHGKTQLLQFLIRHDIVRAQEDGRSVIVLDSQGDLIRTISHLRCFSPERYPEFADRFVLVDPNDVEHPVCLNMFDFNRKRLSGYAPVDREKILNATIELYEYFFGALLGADLTQRQGLIFRYLARLLLEVPDATIHTLRELMEDGERFRPYMEKLSGTARSFFATQFFDKKFGETKKQILTRLWGVLSNSSLERMFSHPRSKIDIFELLNSGKIILINTAKDLLGQEGAAIFGRFFIALIAQAAVQRAAMRPDERRPAFVYIDEAQDYFDDNIANLLNQARKYRVGLVFAHQNLDQLSAGLRSSVLSSTSIKFAGGLSAKDAAILDAEYRADAEFLLSQKKERSETEFACYVKNFTGKALTVRIPLGFVEAQPQLTVAEYENLIEVNRTLYSESPIVPPDVPFPDVRPRRPDQPAKAAETVRENFDPPKPLVEMERPASGAPVTQASGRSDPVVLRVDRRDARVPKEDVLPGRGGRQHKYLQHLVKQLAEERGFRASLEETILDGAGRVDVSLVRDGLRVACQVSVTTTKDWELGSIEKCLAAGYGEVILIGTSQRHVKALAKFIDASLDEGSQGKVRYLAADDVPQYLDGLGKPTTTEQVVKGYKVRTVHQPVDPDDVETRRRAITEVIARSLRNGRGD